MSDMPASLKRAVVRRAGSRCEYCRLAQAGQDATFHVDHIVPRAEDGPTVLDNLALACVSCSLRKGARRHAADPQTGSLEPLFHPRVDGWSVHFAWDDVRVVGLAPSGRATVDLLAMNRPMALAIRREEVVLGRHPPGVAR